MELTQYLSLMAKHRASDLFLSAGARPSVKVEGETTHLGNIPLTGEEVGNIALALMSEKQQKEFEQSMELNLALALEKVGRFRINVYRQRGEVAIAIRYLTDRIPSIEQLNLPIILKDLVMLPRGLVLVVGAAGSGKSTTLASMLDYRNSTRTGHILTVEDPIEYVHGHKQSNIDQREVGVDTHSFADALRNAMRQAPDVIMIGEIRDVTTMQHAIAYAETGHLCLSTLHANNANQALDRIINLFPDSARKQLLMDLSLNLKAVISQRLLQGRQARRIPAVEVLLQTPYVSDLILKGEVDTLKQAMKTSVDRGMQTFDESLFQLLRSGRISLDEALAHADSHTDLLLRVRLSGGLPIVEDAVGMQVTPSDEEQRERAAAQNHDAGWIDGQTRRKDE